MTPSKLCTLLLIIAPSTCLAQTAPKASAPIPPAVHARILQLEDERDIGGDELLTLLKDQRAAVRARAALALGRIGDRRTTKALIDLLNNDRDDRVKETAAFALGESDDQQAVPALLTTLAQTDPKVMNIAVFMRIIEALGKLGSLPAVEDAIRQQISEQILRWPVVAEVHDPESILAARLTITALMRLRSPVSISVLTRYLLSPRAEIRADAANALFRLRRPIAAAVPELIVATTDADPDVRANAARALGVSGDTRALDPLIKLLNDPNPRAAVNAIRGLQLIGTPQAIQPLLTASEKWLSALPADPSMIHLLLEAATALGTFRAPSSLPLLQRLRAVVGVGAHPEVEIAVVRLGVFTPLEELKSTDWRQEANLAAGYGESTNPRAVEALRQMLTKVDTRAVPAVLRALSQRRVEDIASLLRERLASPDTFIRAASAGLLAAVRDEETLNALVNSLAASAKDSQNDAKLAILQSLSGYKTPKAIEAVRSALKDADHLVRRAAIDALRTQGEKTNELVVGPVQTGRTRAFYTQLASRLNRPLTAIIETERGAITLELFTADAPLTVENFAALARRGFFNGIAFHRVVPNFVVQGGDPRGDGEGGPGRQIRCEINTRRYERGALGMALSGKDTGGSQFFITHSPQPHLDGGYTVFGRVARGQDVVDRIARGDRIRRVTIR